MDEHLRKAREALERPSRSISGRGPTAEDYAKAVREILAYLEKLDEERKIAAITVDKFNKPS